MSAAEPEVVAPETPETGKKSRSRNGAKPEVMGTLVEVAPKDLVIEPRREGVDINNLMVHAVQTGNIDTMERVMAIRRELKAEAAKEAFFTALSAFQSECPVIKKSKQGGGGKYWYAPLDVILKMAGPVITRHGLSFKIVTRVEDSPEKGKPSVIFATCHVYHELGHSESSEFSVPVDPSFVNVLKMNEPQAFASASTYAKRYAFCNAFGILTGESDDDGQSAGRYTPNEARAARAPVTQPRETPTAQKAAAQKANGSTKRVDLEPAGEGEAIDANTIKGLSAAMEHAKLGQQEFQKRFPALAGLEQVKKTDSRVVMSWIASPSEN